ncbi:wiskott-Aldrich syndrome protein homolog 1 [Drosophila subobscura]|uniref:wiskott-Aldrich syndrome protein homolog 1 n=1 Tax=Drosophila subobscura TaxID=7241 RepID=UPI00155B30A7|nr:wiskott-Aldrich syndrome protein homolog 1 [Drosophila subobscura]XP_034651445.1 wiskott-Aldrich syndrome protein homolog 1 [Drosophila subobscura]
MKFLIIAVAFLACAFADVSELSGYDYQQPELPAPAPLETYIPPAPPAPAPVESYIPPAPPAPEYIPPAPVQAEQSIIEEIEQPAQDGYRYKTVRRRVFRHRA